VIVRNVSKPLVLRLLGVVIVLTMIGAFAGCSRFTDISSVDAETVEVTGMASIIVEGALKQVGKTTEYDPSYVSIGYPNGDIPLKTGVCSDVVVRSYRHAGYDLQRLLHEDMRRNFAAYPQRWGASQPDPNIDHRRVPNLAAYFKRQGGSVRVTHVGTDYLPGDVVTWSIDGSPHTGVVSNKRKKGADHFFIVNNRGGGTRVEDVLFAWEITGHYRWLG
jgi:uncharacterized protein